MQHGSLILITHKCLTWVSDNNEARVVEVAVPSVSSFECIVLIHDNRGMVYESVGV